MFDWKLNIIGIMIVVIAFQYFLYDWEWEQSTVIGNIIGATLGTFGFDYVKHKLER